MPLSVARRYSVTPKTCGSRCARASPIALARRAGLGPAAAMRAGWCSSASAMARSSVSSSPGAIGGSSARRGDRRREQQHGNEQQAAEAQAPDIAQPTLCGGAGVPGDDRAHLASLGQGRADARHHLLVAARARTRSPPIRRRRCPVRHRQLRQLAVAHDVHEPRVARRPDRGRGNPAARSRCRSSSRVTSAYMPG